MSDSSQPHGLQRIRLPSLSFTYLLEFAQTHICGVSDAIHPSHPLSQPLLLLHSIFPSIRLFSNELALHIEWPKYWSFSFSMSPCNAHSGLISFKIVWLDLFEDQGALKSLLQHTIQSHQFFSAPPSSSTNNYWKNHSFNYMDFSWQSDVSAF